LGGTVFVSKRLKQKQFGTTAKKVKKSVYRDSLLWFTWFQLRDGVPETKQQTRQTMNTNTPTFQIGDAVSHRTWTDIKAGFIVAVSKSGKTVTFQAAKQELLNGPDSGEPDALEVCIGGFFAHTSGRQRYAVSADTTGYKQKFTLRSNGHWKAARSSSHSIGNVLIYGHHPYYDYNF
jgi:hypothetical protein